MEIGSQQIADNMLEADELLEELYGLFGKPRIRLGDPSKDNFTALAPPAEPFWTSLGFSYAAIDYNGHRNSTALDLNTDEVPRDLRGQFDLVINTGTTEHVANQLMRCCFFAEQPVGVIRESCGFERDGFAGTDVPDNDGL